MNRKSKEELDIRKFMQVVTQSAFWLCTGTSWNRARRGRACRSRAALLYNAHMPNRFIQQSAEGAIG